ncbi:MAG: hypothetical protein JXA10_19545 [Anaerolineae bacterium]|nr:hypothetical protein [Anaerolineae bacterium]
MKRVWIEADPELALAPESKTNNGTPPAMESADVLVEMEDSQLWQAHFVTLSHLQEEMKLSLNVAQQYNRALAATQFVAMETPHVVVERLTPDIIEDVVDNLMALGTFETVFGQFSEPDFDGPEH